MVTRWRFRRGGSPTPETLSATAGRRDCTEEALRFAQLVVLALMAWPAVVAGQGTASGTFAPFGPPEHPPVRVDAGGACVVDLVQDYTIDGTLAGNLILNYRILVAGPCGSPAGTFDEEWIAHGTFSGTVGGQEAMASLLYTAQVREGGSVDGMLILRGEVEAELEITGELTDQRLSYSGMVEVPQDGGR